MIKHQDIKQRFGIIGNSNKLDRAINTAIQIAPTDISVLITGESGVGKESMPKIIHYNSQRKHNKYIAVNCGAIPEGTIDSELFGHEKGAFTGAGNRFCGRFEQAEGGTLFLDEIGDMPIDTQTRLLRVLQEGEFTTVGGRIPIKANVRIVAATHHDLTKLVQQGNFREDLYYRLNVVPMRLPPLRERSEDIPDLARYFLQQVSAEGLPVKSIDSDALLRLQAHRWPGNVRELENMIRRLAALYSQQNITVDVIESELAEISQVNETGSGNSESLSEAVENHLLEYFAAYKDALPPNGLYEKIISEIEKPLISISLNSVRGNQVRAAEMLGLNRNTLRKKIRELGIEVIKRPR